jgi:hypothetical protein
MCEASSATDLLFNTQTFKTQTVGEKIAVANAFMALILMSDRISNHSAERKHAENYYFFYIASQAD